MRYIAKLLIVISILLLQSSFSMERIDYRKARFKNVCKVLKDDVLLYLIFVDSKETSPWTEFDIQSTLDSMELAVAWLEKQAATHNIKLNIITDYYIGPSYTTIKKKLPEGSVIQSVYKPNLRQGLLNLNDWADKVAREAGNAIQPGKKDGIPDIDKPRNKERLIAYLRDKYNVESVALLYMVNNYYKDDISISVNTMNDNDVEFSIVSYKYPSEIAHNMLHLYGAADLYETPFRKNKNKIELARQLYALDVMQDPYAKQINKLNLSPFTRYLIGWTDTPDPEYKDLLKDNVIISF